MKVWISAIRLYASTAEVRLGNEVTLGEGLNILRGGNSRGKTQFAQAIIYGLGMERILSARANAPLGSAFTTEVAYATGEGEVTSPTLTSWIAVELMNDRGEALTVQRHVKHQTRSQNLVRVWHGPALSDLAGAGESQDMFLHAAGSASRELGFHSALTDYLGWELPRVATYAGAETILYPDAIFQFLLVDQQSWGSAGPRKVDRFQIRESNKRAVEFLLSLRGPATQKQRDALERRVSEGRATWTATVRSLRSLAAAGGAQLLNLADSPAGSADRDVREPTSLDNVDLQVNVNGEWTLINDALDAIERDLAQRQEPVRRNPDNPALVEELRLVKDELGEATAATQVIESELNLGEAQVAALDRRLDVITEERLRNVDVRTLTRLGSEVEAEHLAGHNCPTCRQSLDAVEADAIGGESLNVDGTIQLLNAQINTTARMRERAMTARDRASGNLAAVQRNADQLRARVRALESDLFGPPAELSASQVTTQVTLELRRDELRRLDATVGQQLDGLLEVASDIAAARTELRSLPTGSPDEDIAVLRVVENEMRSRLRSSGFGSYDVDELKLDEDALRPTREGFDVDTDASASDVVRIKIAYLEAIRKVGTEVGVHPGLLMLDEPRQQDLEETSFAAILEYLARDTGESGQVIITSATDATALQSLLAGVSELVQVHDFGAARVLRRLAAPDPIDI